jgi:hypothetical protein
MLRTGQKSTLQSEGVFTHLNRTLMKRQIYQNDRFDDEVTPAIVKRSLSAGK